MKKNRPLVKKVKRNKSGKFRKEYDVWLYGFAAGMVLLTGWGWSAALLAGL